MRRIPKANLAGTLVLALAFFSVDALSAVTFGEEQRHRGELVRPSGVSAEELGGVRVPRSLRLDVPSLAPPELDLPAGLLDPMTSETPALVAYTWQSSLRTLGRPVATEEAMFARARDFGACVGPLPNSHEDLISTAPRVVMRLTRSRDGAAVARFAALHPAADMARMTNCFVTTFRGRTPGEPNGEQDRE